MSRRRGIPLALFSRTRRFRVQLPHPVSEATISESLPFYRRPKLGRQPIGGGWMHSWIDISYTPVDEKPLILPRLALPRL